MTREKTQYKKIVKWDPSLNELYLWPAMILLAITYPIWYIWLCRQVTYEKIKVRKPKQGGKE